jgi:hypothetical protein
VTTVASSAPSVKRAAGTFQPSFFLWMTVVMTLFIFSGFALTYWIPMAGRSLAPLPPVVHLHGAFFFSWMVLLVVQAVLVSTNNVRTHMSLGTFGIALGTGVFLMGALITIISQGLSNLDPSPLAYSLAYLSVTAVLSFGVLFALAIGNRRRPDAHKRLMLFSTINLLPPGINRLYGVSFGVELPLLATYLTLDALAIAMLVNDWRTNGRITTASATGAAFVFVPQLLYQSLVDSAAFARVAFAIGEMSGYR